MRNCRYFFIGHFLKFNLGKQNTSDVFNCLHLVESKLPVVRALFIDRFSHEKFCTWWNVFWKTFFWHDLCYIRTGSVFSLLVLGSLLWIKRTQCSVEVSCHHVKYCWLMVLSWRTHMTVYSDYPLLFFCLNSKYILNTLLCSGSLRAD